MTHAIDLVISAILLLCGLVMEVVAFVDGFLARLMTSAGFNPQLQMLILVVVAVLLIIAAIRRLGGLLGWLIIILLVLMLLHRALPGMQVPQWNVPGGWQNSGTIHA